MPILDKSRPSSNHPRILIVRLSSLGDVLDTTPVAEAIKAAMPEAVVGWVVDERRSQVLIGNPFIDHLHIWDQKVIGSLRLIRELRSMHYDTVLDVQGLFKSGAIAWVTGAPTRLGFDDAKERSSMFLTGQAPTQPRYARVSERVLGILKEIGISATPDQFKLCLPISSEEELRADEWLRRLALEQKRFAVLAPSTTTPQRHWVPERWAELGDRLWDTLRMKSVVLAGKADHRHLKQVQSCAQTELPISAGDLGIRESACVIRDAAVLVGLDSFPLHVGLTMNTPTIGLFGPTPTDRFEEERGLTLVDKPFHCRPCGRRPTCDGAYTCMKLITIDDILTVVRQLVGRDLSRSSDGRVQEN